MRGDVVRGTVCLARIFVAGAASSFCLTCGRIFLVAWLVEDWGVLAEHHKNGQTGGAGELGSHDREHHGFPPAQLFVLAETISVFWVLLSFSARLARQVYGMAVMCTGILGVFFLAYAYFAPIRELKHYFHNRPQHLSTFDTNQT